MTKSRISAWIVKGALLAVGATGLSADAAMQKRVIGGYLLDCDAAVENCYSGPWKYQGIIPKGILFADTRKSKQKDIVWMLVMPTEGQRGYRQESTIVPYEVNCSAGEIRMRGLTQTNKPWGDGAILKTNTIPSRPTLVAPGTASESIYDFACSRK